MAPSWRHSKVPLPGLLELRRGRSWIATTGSRRDAFSCFPMGCASVQSISLESHVRLSGEALESMLGQWLRIAAGLFFAIALSAQTQSRTGGTGGGTSGGSPGANGSGGQSTGTRAPSGSTSDTNTSSRSQSSSTYNNSRQRTLENLRMPRLLFLYGRVLMANGERPPERVLVKMQCTSGSPRPQGYTDSKGRFNFQPGGDETLMVSDASVSGYGRGPGRSSPGASTANLAACHIFADLPGYRSDRLTLRYYHGFGGKDVGTIVLHPVAGIVGDTLSATSWEAPKSASKAYRKGLQALQRSKPNLEQGIKYMASAVEEYPRYAAAWAMLGIAHLATDDWDGGSQALLKSIEADSRYLRPYEPLIEAAYERKDWAMVDSLAARYLKLSPHSSEIRFKAALAAMRLGKKEQAQQLIENLIDRREASRWPITYAVLGLIHEHSAEFGRAADLYRTFLGHVSAGPTAERVRRVLYEWEKLQVIDPQADSEAMVSSPPSPAETAHPSFGSAEAFRTPARFAEPNLQSPR